MGIHPAAERRIIELGGSPPADANSLQEFLLNTKFPHYLYDKYWDWFGLDELVTQNRGLFDNDLEAFLDLAENHYLSEHDLACGQHFWQPALFTPFTPGTEDFAEWDSFFAQHADLSPIRKVCGDGNLEFIHIIYSYGYPDNFYVCLQDPSCDDPTVFGTDHEVFFQEISARSTLSEFMNGYATRSEFREILREYRPED